MAKQLTVIAAAASALAVAACGSPEPAQETRRIEVRSDEQQQLHRLDSMNLAIALRRAIADAGYACRRVERAGFVAKYENLDMWTATCEGGRQWAIFAGPDGSAQVRDCKDVAQVGLPECKITKEPETAPAGQS